MTRAQQQASAWQRTMLVACMAGAIALVLAASVAHAGGPDTPAIPVGPIQTLFAAMRATVMSWQRSGQNAARGIFAVLAAINLAWAGVEILTAGMDLKGGVLRIARELFVLSLFYKFIDLGPDVADEMVQFFERAGLEATGSKVETSQLVLDKTIEATVGLLKTGGGNMMGLEAIWVGICCIVTIILIGITAAVMWIVEFVSFVVVGVGAIVLGAGGSVWTRFLVANYIKFAGGAGAALYFLRFTQNFVLAHLSAWADQTIAQLPKGSGSVGASVLNAITSGTEGPGPETMLTMLNSLVIQTLLVVVAPSLAAALFAGGGVAGIAERAGSAAARAMRSSGTGEGIRAMGSAASGVAASAKNAVTSAFGGSGSGASLLSASGGAKPAESPRGSESAEAGRSGRGDDRGGKASSATPSSDGKTGWEGASSTSEASDVGGGPSANSATSAEADSGRPEGGSRSPGSRGASHSSGGPSPLGGAGANEVRDSAQAKERSGSSPSARTAVGRSDLGDEASERSSGRPTAGAPGSWVSSGADGGRSGGGQAQGRSTAGSSDGNSASGRDGRSAASGTGAAGQAGAGGAPGGVQSGTRLSGGGGGGSHTPPSSGNGLPPMSRAPSPSRSAPSQGNATGSRASSVTASGGPSTSVLPPSAAPSTASSATGGHVSSAPPPLGEGPPAPGQVVVSRAPASAGASAGSKRPPAGLSARGESGGRRG